MALFAERLPIGTIPEQPGIAPVRQHMIHDGGRRYPALRLTVDAQRMLLQEQAPRLAPLGVVPTGIRAAA